MTRLGALALLFTVLIGCGGGGNPNATDAGGVGGGVGGGAGSFATVTTTRYQITVNQSALGTLPSSCFIGGTPPATPPPATRTLGENWDLVTASTGEQFLIIDGETSFALGDARPILFGDVLTAADGGFPAQVRVNRTLPSPSAPNPNFSDTSTLSTRVELTPSSTGLTGVLHLSSNYACTSCTNNNGEVSCAADLPFTGTVVPTVPAPDPATGSSWRLALDLEALGNLPPSCYANNTTPTNKVERTNQRFELAADIWAGGGASYLQPETVSFALGDADPIPLARAIRGVSPTYSGTITDKQYPNSSSANPNFSSTAVKTATFTLNSGGAVVAGSLQLKSEYTCTSCQNNGGKVNCSATIPFTAIRGGKPLLTAPPAPAGQSFRVAIDDDPLNHLPPTCYLNSVVPVVQRQYTNLEVPGVLTIRSGPVMDVDPSNYPMGDAAPVNLPTLRGLDGGTFYEEQVMTTSTSTDTRSLTVTLNATGQLTTGSVLAKSQYSCTGCTNNNGRVSCTTLLNFNAGAK